VGVNNNDGVVRVLVLREKHCVRRRKQGA